MGFIESIFGMGSDFVPERRYQFSVFCIFYVVLFVILFLKRKDIESKQILCLFFGSIALTFVALTVFCIPAARISAIGNMALLLIYLFNLIKNKKN